MGTLSWSPYSVLVYLPWNGNECLFQVAACRAVGIIGVDQKQGVKRIYKLE